MKTMMTRENLASQLDLHFADHVAPGGGAWSGEKEEGVGLLL